MSDVPVPVIIGASMMIAGLGLAIWIGISVARSYRRDKTPLD
ncbi:MULTISPECIES: hypothetical protein [Rhodoluna]|jgi:hypothetical protein|nr:MULTISPECIES: hypothetical protein [Rhodoluna]BDS48629.1 hypothetical protein RKAS3_02060 [Rhodoluna sp. KAS3]